MGMAANYGLTSVKFLRAWKGYNPGDLAGFHQTLAQKLVVSGVAAFNKVEKPAVSVTKVPVLSPKPKRKDKKLSVAAKKTLAPGTYTKGELLAAIEESQKE